MNVISQEDIQKRMQFRSGLHQLKTDIKRLSTEQTILKRERKTVTFTGDRVHADTPYQAVCMVAANKRKLRHLFALYGEVRNKPVSYASKFVDGYGHMCYEFNTVLLEHMRREYFPVRLTLGDLQDAGIPDTAVADIAAKAIAVSVNK